MENKSQKMSLLSGSLLWFGAAVSIAEILTGVLLAPLGFSTGLLAIIIGHIIGCLLLYACGLIGAKTGKSAMESVSLSFGRYGSVFFSVLNVLQLVGWTAVMIINGAGALGSVVNSSLGMAGNALWCGVIGLLIIVWILAGLKNVGKLNIIAVGALFLLTILLGIVVFKGDFAYNAAETMSFGLALELSIAMPISWLPLIADYTKDSEKPMRFTLFSTLFYFIGSCTMYTIGLGAAIFTGSSDIVQILSSAGLGLAATLIVLLSTVTTTFLDVYSAGESAVNIVPKWNSKHIGILACLIGTVIAAFMPITKYEDFLYLIGSVFVPMATILVVDFFFLKQRSNGQKLNLTNALLWCAGFITYRIFLNIDTPLGSTIPVIIIIAILCILTNYIKKAVTKHV